MDRLGKSSLGAAALGLAAVVAVLSSISSRAQTMQAMPTRTATVRVGTFDRARLVGEEHLDDVFSALAPRLPEIAKRERVALIAEQPGWLGAGCVAVDVTEALVAALPGAKKRKS